MRSGTADYYFHYDGLGSVRNVTSSAGVTQWTNSYEPFGANRVETKNVTSAPENSMKFTGEYLDPTGLYVGTRTGEVFASADAGGSWREVARYLPPVLCVKTAVLA